MEKTASFLKMCYGWSKYNGGMSGLVKDEDDWFCQCCGEKQPKEFPQYMIPADSLEREFFRICSVCKHIQLRNKIERYQFKRLTIIVRKLYPYG
jgi:hypothetical protein